MVEQITIWSDDWSIDPSTPERRGGHGSVVRVIRKRDGRRGALKRLLDGDRTERRRRMAREVRALENLQLRGVPRILLHNMDCVEDKDQELFFIAEWVDGKRLSDYCGGRPLRLDDALSLCRDLAEIVMHSHAVGIVHRDIKPDNIIIGAEDKAVYLVDFGQSFAETPVDDLSTDTGQELGNRFLRLPEMAGGAGKRDPRADVAYLVGVLFFCLTGRKPDLPMDEVGRAPHRRDRIEFPEDVRSDPRWKRVKSIFDIGFSFLIDSRFPDASSLITKLDEAMVYEPTPSVSVPDYEAELDELHDLRRRIDAEIDKREESLIESLNRLSAAIAILCGEYGFGPIHQSAKIVDPGRAAKILWAVRYSNSEEPKVHMDLAVSLAEDDPSKLLVRLRTRSHDKLVSEDAVIYRGYVADVETFREAIPETADRAFAIAVRLLRTKIAALHQASAAPPASIQESK